MRDLLLPRTDAGVLAQVLIVVVLTVLGVVVARRERAVVLLVVGVGVVLLGMMGVRGLH
ncbi:MAG: hypothetical protein WD225_03390 [Ilumatobacteraceae bacterium]